MQAVEASLCSHWANGSKGREQLAHAVVKRAENGKSHYKPLYADVVNIRDVPFQAR